MRKKKLYYTLLFVLFFYRMASGQENRPVLFTHLTTDNGLSESSVTCILKDRYGFMWFGTGDGLNKYDGYKFRVFRNKSGDPKTIPSNNITALYEDKSGELWVGTRGWGLAKYNRTDDSFTSYGGGMILSICESSDSTLLLGTYTGIMTMDKKAGKAVAAKLKNIIPNLVGQTVSKIYEDSRKNIWIGTYPGVFLLDKASDKMRTIVSNSYKNITEIAEDDNGLFWVGTSDGLYAFSYLNDTLIRERSDITIPAGLSKAFVTSVCVNKDHTLWIGKTNELTLYNPADGTCRNFRKIPQDEQSLSHNSVWSLYLDDQGILWAGTSGGGISKYDKNQMPFPGYRLYDPKYPALIPNIVTSFEEDPTGNIWIGTEGGGLFLWEISAKRFTSFHLKAAGKNFFPSYSVTALKLSRDKERLWLGTNDQGLIELNIHTRSMRFFNMQNGMLKNNCVTTILEDKNGDLWIGTNGGGISMISDVKGKVKHSTIHPNTAIRTLFEDVDGSIWLNSYFGVRIYHPRTKNFSEIVPGSSNISGVINQIFRDSKNNIWLATPEKGLQLFDRKSKSFTAYTEGQGLAGNIVNSIVEDTRGYLWMGTSRGVSRFDPHNHTFKNYSKKDGLLNNHFEKGAGYITKAGMILMGSSDGFTAFYPEDDKVNTNIPPVVITDFQLFGKSLPAEMYVLPKKNKNSIPEINLSYNQSFFSIEFAALSFTVPEKNQYAYMLEGFDKDWHYTGNEHKATYTNLDPGTYIFRGIASNNDGLWNREGTALKIIIAPPFWKTKTAYVLYLLAAAIILYYLYREIKARERLKNEIIFQKFTAGKMEELNQMKLNFFTNISHELRTPLSLIIDPLRKIIHEKVSPEQASYLSNMAFKNVTRLSNLVNQLLDFRRTGGRYKLNPQHINIVDTVNEICQSFEEKAREREIGFEISFSTVFTQVWIDPDELEKILTNLVSNAFKFTPDGGKIQVTVSTHIEANEKKMLEIRVKDTGSGIPESYKQKIFDLFFQVEGTPRYDMESSGIGLSLVKELVTLHGGEIRETGKQGDGALFEVKLPVEEYNFEGSGHEAAGEIPAIHIPEESLEVSDDFHETPTILLVEDNAELREYITKEALSRYHVEQAAGGAEGFEKAVMLIPDLIISDIMMPEGNGLELCEKLKADEKTSHVPVILLTARQTDDHKIEGYKKGADAYISKPFNSSLLITQVENLLESRKKLRMLFSGTETRHAAEAEVMDIDKEFLKKAEQVILNNLSNEQFEVIQLSSHLKMNRRQLSRKLQAITNYTPQTYIAIVRLRRGAELLAEGNLNISEVAYKVGFAEPSSFTRAFTKVYGKSPRKYLSEIVSGRK